MEKKSFKITGYDPIAQQALNEIRPELTTNKVYEVTIDTTCNPNVAGYVTTGNIHVIHLCMNNIKKSLGRNIEDPQRLKEAMKTYIKDIVMKHEMKHVEQLGNLEQHGQMNKAKAKVPSFESEAEKQEQWKNMENIGIQHKASSLLDSVANILESKGYLKEAYQIDVISNTIDKLAYPYYDVLNPETGAVIERGEDFHLEHFSKEDVQNLLEDFDKGLTIELPRYYYNKDRKSITHGTTKINKNNIELDPIFEDHYNHHTIKNRGSLNPVLRYNRELHKIEPIKFIEPAITPETAPVHKFAAVNYTQRNIGENIMGEFVVGDNTYEYAIGGSDFGMPEARFTSKKTIGGQPTDDIRGDVGGPEAVIVFKTFIEIIRNWAGATHPDRFFLSSDNVNRNNLYDSIAKRISGYNYNPQESERILKAHADLGEPVNKVWVLERLINGNKREASTSLGDINRGSLDYYYKHDSSLTPEKLNKIHKGLLATFNSIKFYLVDATYIRDNVDDDYTMGGNPGRYVYVPMDEIWIDKTMNKEDILATMLHEYTEMRKMEEENLSYNEAHNFDASVEIGFRNNFKSMSDPYKEFINIMEKYDR